MRTVAMTLLRIRKKMVFMGAFFPLPLVVCSLNSEFESRT